MRILCTGDLHLGRHPTKIPPVMSGASFSPRAVLERCVHLAKELEVDVFVLTGDVVDQTNAYIEAYAALRSSITELLAAGIRVVGIAGNHDYRVLPRLSEEIDEFRLLLKGNDWDEELIRQDDEVVLRIQGKSFTSEHSSENPLVNYIFPKDDIPTVALLHCDVDLPGSVYAPVSLGELKNKPPIAWLLGHIHKSSLLSRDPLILYPGSPQGMDPSETGEHGPWLIEIDRSNSVKAELCPIAALRYQHIEVPLDEAEEEEDIQPLIVRALRDWYDKNLQSLAETEAVACRLIFTGQTSAIRAIPKVAAGLAEEPLIHLDNLCFIVEQAIIDRQPKITLESLIAQQDHLGLLARKLVILRDQTPAEDYSFLIGEARRDLAKRHADFSRISPEETKELDEESLRRHLRQAGMFILAELIAQKVRAV